MVVLTFTSASRYHNICIDGGTSPEYFGHSLVYAYSQYNFHKQPLLKHIGYVGCYATLYWYNYVTTYTNIQESNIENSEQMYNINR
jgi:CMP-2-keto-3-deoxyoctulosonic acid synthetase